MRLLTPAGWHGCTAEIVPAVASLNERIRDWRARTAAPNLRSRRPREDDPFLSSSLCPRARRQLRHQGVAFQPIGLGEPLVKFLRRIGCFVRLLTMATQREQIQQRKAASSKDGGSGTVAIKPWKFSRRVPIISDHGIARYAIDVRPFAGIVSSQRIVQRSEVCAVVKESIGPTAADLNMIQLCWYRQCHKALSLRRPQCLRVGYPALKNSSRRR